MLQDIQLIIGIVGATVGVCSFIYKPNLKPILDSLQDITKLLRDTRQSYVTKHDCELRHKELSRNCVNHKNN